MTLRDDIVAGTRKALDAIGETTWTYRTLSSEPDAEADGYTAAAALTPAHLGNKTVTETFENKSGGFVRKELAGLRVYSSFVLNQGDQVIDPDSKKWHVDGIMSIGVGITKYMISRELPLVGSVDRGGGV